MAHRGRGAAVGSALRPAHPQRDPHPRDPHPQAALRQRLRAVVAPVVEAARLDLEDLTVVRVGRRIVVRVVVDGDGVGGGGIGHTELGEVSRDISASLDEAEAASGEISDGPYTLEVSSPGVDRPLTLLRHWRRNVGRLVSVKIATPQPGSSVPPGSSGRFISSLVAPTSEGRLVTARIVQVGEDGVTLERDGRREAISFDRLGPGRVQVEFAHQADVNGDAEPDSDRSHRTNLNRANPGRANPGRANPGRANPGRADVSGAGPNSNSGHSADGVAPPHDGPSLGQEDEA